MRSMKDWPGSWVISTTMRSEVTRVPPVTALRSPPDSRMTGADSPVIADSSTVAMPSITVPSPGISSPAGTTTTSPRTSSAAAFVVPSRIVATVSLRIVRNVSACARPRPSANASAMFANTTVSHSQKAIVNVYQASSWPPPSGLPPNAWISHVTVVMTEPISTTNITGLWICTRGSSFLRLSISARQTMSRWNSEIACRSWVAGTLRGHQPVPPVRRSSARFSSSTFTPGSPEKPSPRASVYLEISPSTDAQREPALGRDAVGLDPGVGLRDFRVEVRGGRVHRVHGNLAPRSGPGRRAC